QRRGDLRFLPEPGERLAIPGETALQDLDGERPGQPRVGGEVDLAAAPLRQRTHDPIRVLQDRTDREARGRGGGRCGKANVLTFEHHRHPQCMTPSGRGRSVLRPVMRYASRANLARSIGLARNASTPAGRFDSEISVALIAMPGTSLKVRLFRRVSQNAQPSMTGIIRSSRMNAGAVGSAASSFSASSPSRAPMASKPA